MPDTIFKSYYVIYVICLRLIFYIFIKKKNLVIFKAPFKSLPCFQCSWNLQGIFIND